MIFRSARDEELHGYPLLFIQHRRDLRFVGRQAHDFRNHASSLYGIDVWLVNRPTGASIYSPLAAVNTACATLCEPPALLAGWSA